MIMVLVVVRKKMRPNQTKTELGIVKIMRS